MYSRSKSSRRTLRITHGEPSVVAFPKKSTVSFLGGIFSQLWQRRLAGWDRASHQSGGSETSEHPNHGQGGPLPTK